MGYLSLFGLGFLNLLSYLFNFRLHWVFIAACRLSPVEARGGLLSSCSAHSCFSCRCAQALGLWALVVTAGGLACGLSHHGTLARRSEHVGSCQTRDRICVPGTGRWILNHWTTRGALVWFLDFSKSPVTSSLPFLAHMIQVKLPHNCLYRQGCHPHHGTDGSHRITPHPWLRFWELPLARHGFPEKDPIIGARM